MGYWFDYPTKPRRPANGIRARSQRGKFGQTWWAGQWLAALDRLVDSARLQRGRSYARSGQVLNLDVGPDGVSSCVQGSRPRPYNVTIRFRSLTDEEWEKVADAMASEAIYAAKLLAGEMPQDIEDVFRRAGAHLFPAAGADLVTECSCPDYANPCKHVAAVYYLLGERFDEDPFLLFLLRGRSREEIAAALRTRRAGEAPPAGAGEEVTEAEIAAEADVPLLGATPDVFWTLRQDLSDLARPFVASSIAALPVKQRGRPPFWHSDLDFNTVMEALYGAIEEHAYAVVTGED